MRAWPVQLVNRGWSDGLSRYCVASAVPSLWDSTLFHFYFPALTCEAFPCRRFGAGAIARPTFFAALGVATQTRSRPSGTRPGFRLRPKPQQRLSQPPMPLRQMQVEHFIRFGFGAEDSDEVFFFFLLPRTQFRHIGQDERKILEGCLLQGRPRRRADVTSHVVDFHT